MRERTNRIVLAFFLLMGVVVVMKECNHSSIAQWQLRQRRLRGSSQPAGGTYNIPHIGSKGCSWIPWRKETLCIDTTTGEQFTPKVNKVADRKALKFKLPS